MYELAPFHFPTVHQHRLASQAILQASPSAGGPPHRRSMDGDTQLSIALAMILNNVLLFSVNVLAHEVHAEQISCLQLSNWPQHAQRRWQIPKKCSLPCHGKQAIWKTKLVCQVTWPYVSWPCGLCSSLQHHETTRKTKTNNCYFCY